MMRRADEFVAMILTHGRPDRVHTMKSLRRHGHTGRVVIVIDDEDKRADDYRREFGDDVVTFCKRDVWAMTESADNRLERGGVVLYARNATWEIARRLGVRYFVQLDDDYLDFRHKRDERDLYINKADIRDLDAVFDAMLDYFEQAPQLLSIAMAQGGDFPGGDQCTSRYVVRRKAMNSFICSVERPFMFCGRLNEDVSTCVIEGQRGGVFLTIPNIALQQVQTQANAGGMSDVYQEQGTYVKSFYSVVFAPSCVKVSMMGSRFRRIHHAVAWSRAVPRILPERYRKPRPELEGGAG